MIGKLTGTFGGVSVEGQALIEVQGVGYAVRIPLHAVERLTPGSKASFFIHTAVRDDAIDLFGFMSEEELAFFKMLTSVSGLGPKSALSILNTADIAGLKRAIGSGDTGTLHKVFGIGRKTAERVVVELRDKFEGAGAAAQGTDAEVIEALTALGYRLDESRQAIAKAKQEGMGDVRLRLAAALRELGSGK